METNNELLNERYIFDRVVNWNVKRDNTAFKHELETQMLAEELFEFCGYERKRAKELGIDFANIHSVDGMTLILADTDIISELADAAGDLIFIAIGTISKLGLDPYEVVKKICDHNDAKGSKKDAQGKIVKDADFVEPIHEVQ